MEVPIGQKNCPHFRLRVSLATSQTHKIRSTRCSIRKRGVLSHVGVYSRGHHRFKRLHTKRFPLFLRRAKSVLSFLRQSTNMQALERSFVARGFRAPLAILKRQSYPSFAEWRWSKLLVCCRCLRRIWRSLVNSFDARPFQQDRDRARLADVLAALGSASFTRQLDFVLWFCEGICTIQNWGSGCSCHEEYGQIAPNVQCNQKGRRLKQAWPYATESLRRLLDESNQWSLAEFDGDVMLWRTAQGCMRKAFVYARSKIQFLDTLPYNLVRVDTPGVRDQCVAQWGLAPPNVHHNVTRTWMDPAQSLRAHVDNIAPDGSNVSRELRKALVALENIPLDDSIAEEPHARAARLGLHARGAKFPWIAASMRTQQNVKDVESHPEALDRNWRLWKSLMQTGHSRERNRNAKIMRAAYLQRIYHPSHLVGFQGPANDLPMPGGDDSDGNGDDGVDDPSDHGRDGNDSDGVDGDDDSS